VIGAHDFGSMPLFLFHAFHVVHTPLQVPAAFLNRPAYKAAAAACTYPACQRATYDAMVYIWIPPAVWIP